MSQQTQPPPGHTPDPVAPEQPSTQSPRSGIAKEVAKGIGVGLIKKFIGVLVVIGVAAGAYFLFFRSSDAATVKVGQCLSATGGAGDVEVHKVGCDDAAAMYKVAAKSDTCDDAEVSYTYRYGHGDASSIKLCLGYNVKVGECVVLSLAGADQKVPCAGAKSPAVQVLKVDATTADPKACPKATTKVLPNVTRKSLICLGAIR